MIKIAFLEFISFFEYFSIISILLLVFIMIKNDITQNALSEKLNIPLRTIKRAMQNLKNKGKIQRVGSDRKGYWKVI